jgi:hypothetical protein
MLAMMPNVVSETTLTTEVEQSSWAPDNSLSQDATHDAWLLQVGCRLTKWGSLIPRLREINHVDDTGPAPPHI